MTDADALRSRGRLTSMLGRVGAGGVQAGWEARCAEEGVPCDVQGRPAPAGAVDAGALVAAALGCGCGGVCGC